MSWPPKNLEDLLHRSAAILRTAGAQEVYVFGSAATGKMHEHSDVDLAVSGLSPRIYFKTLGRLATLFGRPVDLVLLEDESPFVRYLKSKAGLLQRVA